MANRPVRELVPQGETLAAMGDLRQIEPGGGMVLTVLADAATEDQVIFRRTPGIVNFAEQIAHGWELTRIYYSAEGKAQYYDTRHVRLLSSPGQILTDQVTVRQDPHIAWLEHLTYEKLDNRNFTPGHRQVFFTPKILKVTPVAALDWGRFMLVPKLFPYPEPVRLGRMAASTAIS